MRLKLAFAFLIAAMAPAVAQVQPACGYGQNCPAGSNQVPFPVVSPAQGLANVLAPIATPPPVLPPGTNP